MRTTIRLFLLVCGLWLCLASSSTQAAPPAITLADMLLQADALRVGGDYPAALAMYQKVVAQAGAEPSSDDLPLARTALYRMAQTSALDLNYAQAAETWQSFLERYPDDARRPLALLQQANALRQQKNLLAAFVAYQAYRNSAPADDPSTGSGQALL